MKTIQDIQDEISETKRLLKENGKCYGPRAKSAEKKLRAELSRLKDYALYLETSPSEQYCRNTAERLADTIDRITQDVAEQIKLMESKSRAKVKTSVRTGLLKDRGVPKLRTQLQQLNYLLN